MNNKEIINKVIEIREFIENSTLYKNYLKSRELVNSDIELMTLIDNIKKYQKEIIKSPHKKEELEIKIDESLEILNNNPTYLEYINLQEEVNNLLTIFENKINKYFDSVFN